MRYLVAILFPPLGTLLFAGLIATLLNVMLIIVSFGMTLVVGPLLWWIPMFHAIVSISSADRRRLERKIMKRADRRFSHR